MHEVLVNRLGGLSLPRKSVVRLTDRHDMTLDVYFGRKTTMQQQQLGPDIVFGYRTYIEIAVFEISRVDCISIHLKIPISHVTTGMSS